MKFKVGDRVEFRGKKGRIVHIHPKDWMLNYPIEVEFDDITAEIFTYDGRVFSERGRQELIKIDLDKKIQKILNF